MQPTTDGQGGGSPPLFYSSSSRIRTLLLALILLAGAALRMYNIAWDEGTMPHPDERSTVAFYAPSIRWPDDLATALDPHRSPLNPFWDIASQTRRSYTYGHFPLYVLVLTAGAAQSLAPLAASLDLPAAWLQFLVQARTPEGYAYLGRFLMALSDTATIYLVYLLGRRLYGAWAGLLAAAFSAFTVLQIQLAHFFAVDPVSTTFTLLALYGAILMYDRRSAGAAVLAGVGIGLAVSSKYSAAPIAAAPLVAVALSAMQAPPEDRAAARRLGIRNLLIAGAVAFVVFAVTSPFVLLDFQDFWQAVVKEQGDMVSGVADFPFTRQYRGTLPYLYFIDQQIRWGMGWPLGLLAFAGLAWVLIRAIWRRASPGEWILLSWVILYFGPTGLFLAKFMRYMVPVDPLFVLFGAGLVAGVKLQIANHKSANRQVSASIGRPIQIGESEPQRNEESGQEIVEAPNGAGEAPLGSTFHAPPAGGSGRARFTLYASYLKLAAAAIALVGAIVWSLAFVNGVYGRENSWITASRWVYANVPDGSCIVVEHWEEGFPRSWDEPGMNPGAHAYRQPLLPMYEEDTRAKFETLRDTLRDCDYLVLASNRLWRTIPRLPQRYPMSTAYYQDLFDGKLGFQVVYTQINSPRLGPLVINDQAADESFTVYDHPQPIIFKKVRQLSDAEWEALLGNAWQGAVHGYVGPPTLLMRLRGWTGPDSPSQPVSNFLSPAPESRKSLLLDRPVDELPVVDDYHWNTAASHSAALAIVTWWLAVQAIGWLAWPLARRLFRRLPDQGYLLSKSLGWLLVGYGVWLGASLRLPYLGTVLPNTLPTVIVMLVILAGVAFLLLRRDAGEVRAFLKNAGWLILAGEAIFTAVFLYFVGLRLFNPDLWQPWNGGEKMMEIGFLNAIVKSAAMPPYDPYFAGTIINYYYYGLFLVGVLIKLTGIQPTVAFNLAVPTLAALTAANAFSLAFGLAFRPQAPSARLRGLVVGLLAVLLVVLVGNLAGFDQWLRMLQELGQSTFESGIPGLAGAVHALAGLKSVVFEGAKLPAYNYWDPSRVIPNTINEFPYWSFLFADLHPHMIGIPFTVLLLSSAYVWLRGAFEDDRGGVLGTLLRWLSLSFCLGALAAINTWDLPTYLGLVILTFWLGRYRRSAGGSPLTAARLALEAVAAALFGALTFAASYLLYLPFFLNYQALDVGLGLVHDKTDLEKFLFIWGLVLFVVVSYLLATLTHPQSRMAILRAVSLFLRRWRVAPHLTQMYGALVQGTTGSYWAGLWSLIVVAGLAVGLWALDYRVPAVLLPLVWLSFLFLLRPEPDAGHAFAGLLLFTGVLILLGVEVFFLRDFLGGGDYYRMNTLFKFYIQVWVILGIAAAYLIAHVWERVTDRRVLGKVWQMGMMLLVAAALVYPVMGTPSRVRDRFALSPGFGTLDGMAYMATGEFTWPQDNSIVLQYDYEAIRWLQNHVKGTPVLAEAKIGYYREGGMRVASYTGLPMPLGGLHQNEQHWPDQVGQRDELYREFWDTPDPARAWDLIQQLDISYIYIGQLERSVYTSPGALVKFDALAAQGRLAIAYQNERTRIYEVTNDK
jgi:YYY domain-containing protein